jgi:hypothetical protein
MNLTSAKGFLPIIQRLQRTCDTFLTLVRHPMRLLSALPNCLRLTPATFRSFSGAPSRRLPACCMDKPRCNRYPSSIIQQNLNLSKVSFPGYCPESALFGNCHLMHILDLKFKRVIPGFWGLCNFFGRLKFGLKKF